jgi:hypothetical protein
MEILQIIMGFPFRQSARADEPGSGECPARAPLTVAALAARFARQRGEDDKGLCAYEKDGYSDMPVAH